MQVFTCIFINRMVHLTGVNEITHISWFLHSWFLIYICVIKNPLFLFSALPFIKHQFGRFPNGLLHNRHPWTWLQTNKSVPNNTFCRDPSLLALTRKWDQQVITTGDCIAILLRLISRIIILFMRNWYFSTHSVLWKWLKINDYSKKI